MNPRESSVCRNCGSWELINPRLFRQIKEQEKEAEREKKIPKCNSCGEKVDAGLNFCPNCHDPLKKACYNCGGLNSVKSTICASCGRTDFLDVRTSRKFENLVIPEEIQVNQNFIISGQVVSFVGTPGNSAVYLNRQDNPFCETEAEPEEGYFEFSLRLSEVGEYEYELTSGVARKKSFKVKVVRRQTPSEEIRSRSSIKRLCLRDGCDTRIEGYQHYCPSKECSQNQELKFKFWGDDRMFDRINCDRCWSYEKGIDKFFLDRNDDTFFRTIEHPQRHIPENHEEVIRQARLYECPICKQRGEPGVKRWVLIPETKVSRSADALTGFLETAGDWARRGFRAAKEAREKQVERVQKKNGGSRK